MDYDLITSLRSKYPEVFNGWDGYETSIKIRDRKGEAPVAVVTLYNKAKRSFSLEVSLHACFELSINNQGEESIRIGGVEILQKYDEFYLPKKFRS